MCHYECLYFENSGTNPECLDPLSEEFENIGGAIPFFTLMLCFFFLMMLMFSMQSYRSQVINDYLREMPEKLYTVWGEDNDLGRGRIFENDISLND